METDRLVRKAGKTFTTWRPWLSIKPSANLAGLLALPCRTAEFSCVPPHNEEEKTVDPDELSTTNTKLLNNYFWQMVIYIYTQHIYILYIYIQIQIRKERKYIYIQCTAYSNYKHETTNHRKAPQILPGTYHPEQALPEVVMFPLLNRRLGDVLSVRYRRMCIPS